MSGITPEVPAALRVSNSRVVNGDAEICARDPGEKELLLQIEFAVVHRHPSADVVVSCS